MNVLFVSMLLSIIGLVCTVGVSLWVLNQVSAPEVVYFAYLAGMVAVVLSVILKDAK